MQIQAKLKEGYELHGGPFLETNGQYPATYQAMIRRKAYQYSIIGSDHVQELQKEANSQAMGRLESMTGLAPRPARYYWEAPPDLKAEITILRAAVRELSGALDKLMALMGPGEDGPEYYRAEEILTRHAKTIGECK